MRTLGRVVHWSVSKMYVEYFITVRVCVLELTDASRDAWIE